MTTPTAPQGAQPCVSLDAGDTAPDLFVQAADGVWCPAYRVRDRVLDRVFVTSVYVVHPDGTHATTPERVGELAAVGRVMAPAPVIAVVNDDDPLPPARPVRAADRPVERTGSSARFVELDEAGPTRWEKVRRLLNARCGQFEKHTGEVADDVRHRAAAFVSGGRTPSSMELTESETEDAVSFVEHELDAAGFDLDAADAEYRERRAARDGVRQAA